MKVYREAVLPKGFLANGLFCGIKREKKLDLALFYSEFPAKVSALFTTNKIQSAPIKINKRHLKKNQDSFRAIIVNSGNANAFTGKEGITDALEIIGELSKRLKIKKEEILVASTGVIGKRLPILKIKRSIPNLVSGLSSDGIIKAKEAILTTDTFPKELTIKFRLGKNTVTLCGIAKGAGMIFPNLATMLCFIFTDINITRSALDKALKEAVDFSFNCITVDGCMSTNDSVIILANGKAGNPLIKANSLAFKIFRENLKKLCLELAKLIVKDAEGATKFIKIKVNQAKNYSEAKKVALSIANSNLFKSAIYGENPNFGRIVSAVGASGINLNEDKLKIRASSLKRKEIEVEVFLNQGKSSAVVYTSDLTPEYIKINAAYN